MSHGCPSPATERYQAWISSSASRCSGEPSGQQRTAAPAGDAEQLAHETMAIVAGDVLEDVEARGRLEGPVVEGQRVDRHDHVGRLVDVDGQHAGVRKEARELPGEAADVDEVVGRADEVGDDQMALPGIGCAQHAVGQERAQPLRRSTACHGATR